MGRESKPALRIELFEDLAQRACGGRSSSFGFRPGPFPERGVSLTSFSAARLDPVLSGQSKRRPSWMDRKAQRKDHRDRSWTGRRSRSSVAVVMRSGTAAIEPRDCVQSATLSHKIPSPVWGEMWGTLEAALTFHFQLNRLCENEESLRRPCLTATRALYRRAAAGRRSNLDHSSRRFGRATRRARGREFREIHPAAFRPMRCTNAKRCRTISPTGLPSPSVAEDLTQAAQARWSGRHGAGFRKQAIAAKRQLRAPMQPVLNEWPLSHIPV